MRNVQAAASRSSLPITQHHRDWISHMPDTGIQLFAAAANAVPALELLQKTFASDQFGPHTYRSKLSVQTFLCTVIAMTLTIIFAMLTGASSSGSKFQNYFDMLCAAIINPPICFLSAQNIVKLVARRVCPSQPQYAHLDQSDPSLNSPNPPRKERLSPLPGAHHQPGSLTCRTSFLHGPKTEKSSQEISGSPREQPDSPLLSIFVK